MPLTLWPVLQENPAPHPLEPKCANPTPSTVLTPRSCAPSWCNVWPLNGSSQTFYLPVILDPIPCGWMTGLSLSSSSSQPSAPTTQSPMLRTSLITFKWLGAMVMAPSAINSTQDFLTTSKITYATLPRRPTHVTGSVRRKFSTQINLLVPTTSLPTNPVVPPLILARESPLPPPMPAPLWGMLIPHHPTSLSLATLVTSCLTLPPQIPTSLESWQGQQANPRRKEATFGQQALHVLQRQWAFQQQLPKEG
ncbi:hypothetical protein ID866_11730 [Astraeus odoratus]|nr:hypothetical protein ID866_11730 [Astraeus odoratus]